MLVARNGKVLLVEGDAWNVPLKEVGDGTPTETAAKAFRDAAGTGIELEKPVFSGEVELEEEISLWHLYLGTPDGEIEMDGLEWFEPGELDDLDLAPNLEQVLPGLRNL